MIKMHHVVGLFPQVQNFPNGEPLALAEFFPNLEIHDPYIRKTHMSDTSQCIYVCACMSVQPIITIRCLLVNQHNYSQSICRSIAVQKGYLVCMSDPFITQSVYHLQYQCLHPGVTRYQQLQLLFTRSLRLSKLGFKRSLVTAFKHNHLIMPALNSEVATHNQTLYSSPK